MGAIGFATFSFSRPSVRTCFLISRIFGRETGEDSGGRRLDIERHFLDADVIPLRRGSGAGTGAVLDRHAGAVAVATLPDFSRRLAARLTRSTDLRLLCHHRPDHLGPIGSPYRFHAIGQSQQ